LLSNVPLLGAVLFTVLLQLMIIYVPLFNPIFHTAPLPARDLGLCFLWAAPVLAIVEVEKWLVRRGRLYAQPLAQANAG
jgi:Ca2+-transporting ATPase